MPGQTQVKCPSLPQSLQLYLPFPSVAPRLTTALSCCSSPSCAPTSFLCPATCHVLYVLHQPSHSSHLLPALLRFPSTPFLALYTAPSPALSLSCSLSYFLYCPSSFFSFSSCDFFNFVRLQTSPQLVVPNMLQLS